jgi:hypothetical protein
MNEFLDDVREFLDTHKKFLVALAAGLTAAVAVVADGEFSLNDAVVIASALIGGPAAVERVPNRTAAAAKARKAKRVAKREARG